MEIDSALKLENIKEDDLNKITDVYIVSWKLNYNINKIYLLINLKKIFLRDVSISEYILCLSNLSDIAFIKCEINKQVLNNFDKFKKLTKLCLVGCKIDKIPDCIYKNNQLRELTLNQNNISRISSKIKYLVNLREFYLSGNKNLKNLPTEINFLHKLKILHLPYTCLKFNIGGLFNLSKLSIEERHSVPEYFIYKSKMLIISEIKIDIPNNITHLNYLPKNCTLSNASINLNFLKIDNYNKPYQLPIGLKELYIENTPKNIFTLKVPFGCVVYDSKNKIILD